MAKLHSPISLTGKVGGLSVCQTEGVERPVVRGIDRNRREKVRRAPRFEGTRRTIRELGGRFATTAAIGQICAPLKACGGYRQSGVCCALLMPVQALDTVSPWGQRGVPLARSPYLLEGFNLSAVRPFEAVVRQPLPAIIHREALSATLGVMADHVCSKLRYKPLSDYSQLFPRRGQAPWLNASGGAEALTLALPCTPPGDSFTPVLTAGVQMGDWTKAIGWKASENRAGRRLQRWGEETAVQGGSAVLHFPAKKGASPMCSSCPNGMA